jgi:hypothetical protein
MEPVRLLWWREKYSNLDILPNENGMNPVISLNSSAIDVTNPPVQDIPASMHFSSLTTGAVHPSFSTSVEATKSERKASSTAV